MTFSYMFVLWVGVCLMAYAASLDSVIYMIAAAAAFIVLTLTTFLEQEFKKRFPTQAEKNEAEHEAWVKQSLIKEKQRKKQQFEDQK